MGYFKILRRRQGSFSSWIFLYVLFDPTQLLYIFDQFFDVLEFRSVYFSFDTFQKFEVVRKEMGNLEVKISHIS